MKAITRKMKPFILALITARGGSKGLLRKNLRELKGKPLLAHSIEAAKGCPLIHGTYVSTDDTEIADAARTFGADVIDRPADLATDESKSSQAVAHALRTLRDRGAFPDIFVLLQPTSPLRTSDHVTECLEGFLASGAASAMSVTELEHHPKKALLLDTKLGLIPLGDEADLERPRQDLPSAVRQNGAIYAMDSEAFLRRLSFYAPPAYAYFMTEADSLDIDTEAELEHARKIMNLRDSQTSDVFAFPNAYRRFGKPVDMSQLYRDFRWRRKTAGDQKSVAMRYHTFRRTPLKICPICGNSDFTPFVKIYGYPFAECVECGDIFMLTPLDPESVRKLYDGVKGEKSIQEDMYLEPEIFSRRVEQISRPKIAFSQTFLPRKGRWVDIGCGPGELLAASAEAGFRPVGVDADPSFIAFGREKGFEMYQGFLPSPELNHLLKSAAVVSMINVLEHVGDPVGFLTELVWRIDCGTHVVFEVPRHPSISSLANQAWPDHSFRHIYPPDHLNIFSERAAETMLERTGLKAVAVWNFGQDYQEVISSIAMDRGLENSKLVMRLLQGTLAAQQTFDELGFSDALFVVAVKE